MREVENKLKVGVSVKLGNKYLDEYYNWMPYGSVITLIEGCFECENGLYTETQTAPAIWDEKCKEFSSIYHLWGNDLEDFADCEIIENSKLLEDGE